jgi:uncharacterized membrane protein YqiK
MKIPPDWYVWIVLVVVILFIVLGEWWLRK